MARLIKRRWEPTSSSGLPRRDRQGCDYQAYLPDFLDGRPISLTGDTAADVADAENAVTRLNAEVNALVDTEAVARLLLRSEAIASSLIEGLQVGGRRLLKAEAARVMGDEPSDVTAVEVLNNIEAMRLAVEKLGDAPSITVSDILSIHRCLLAGTRLQAHGGTLRPTQNWIGGSEYNPCSAEFIPPPPEHVQPLLEDLCTFCNGESLPAVAQAAIAHAQFETIHPFVDGNGRTGRALIHAVLRRRGLTPSVLPPVSLVLATWAADYVAGLTATRYTGSQTSAAAHDGLNRWIGLFGTATRRAVADAEQYQARVSALQAEWRQRMGGVRANSAADLLINALPGAPMVTVASAAALIGRSEQAANQAIPRLADAGILRQINVGRRNRAFEATELIDAFTDLERRLASPEADTRFSPPSRTVPRRPTRGRARTN